MEVKFSELKKKKVVNILDGKVLGFVTDIVFDFPEGKISAFVCGDKKSLFCKEEVVVCLCDVNKIGDDTVLVCFKEERDCKRKEICEDE